MNPHTLDTFAKFVAIFAFGLAGAATKSLFQEEKMNAPVVIACGLGAAILAVLLIRLLGLTP